MVSALRTPWGGARHLDWPAAGWGGAGGSLARHPKAAAVGLAPHGLAQGSAPAPPSRGATRPTSPATWPRPEPLWRSHMAKPPGEAAATPKKLEPTRRVVTSVQEIPFQEPHFKLYSGHSVPRFGAALSQNGNGRRRSVFAARYSPQAATSCGALRRELVGGGAGGSVGSKTPDRRQQEKSAGALTPRT